MSRGEQDPLEVAITLTERLHDQVTAPETHWPVVEALAHDLATLARGHAWLARKPPVTAADRAPVDAAISLVEHIHDLVVARVTDWARVAAAATRLTVLAERQGRRH